MTKIGIIGGGAWGTALAAASARAGAETTLWALEEEVATAINSYHENTVFLPDIGLPPVLAATNDMADLRFADVVLMVCPAQFMRTVAADLSKHIGEKIPLIVCAKGIEQTTGKLMDDVLAEVAPTHPVGVLSGPTFASEVAKGLPAALTLASADEGMANTIMTAIGTPSFRPYWTPDVTGALVGGALKNVLAIACGISYGKKLGENARAALITRGLNEIVRFGLAKGAEMETLMGLSGVGDLILTCSSLQSRNMSLGSALGEGKTMEEILSTRKSVSEGVYTAKIIQAVADDLGIDMPICGAVYSILHENKDVTETIEDLLSRPFTKETV